MDWSLLLSRKWRFLLAFVPHDIIGGRAALELGEVAVGCGIAAEADGEEEGLLADLWILSQHGGHVFHAAAVHIVVETHARMLLDAAGHIDAVGAQRSADDLYRRVGIAPILLDVHQVGNLLPQVALGYRDIAPVTPYIVRQVHDLKPLPEFEVSEIEQ